MSGMPDFVGAAGRFTDGAVSTAAATLGCEVAAVRAVMDVESRGGFQQDRRPKILFERHHFSRLTRGVHDRQHPDISSPSAGGYIGGSAEYGRLTRACALDVDAALQSASWGAFQVMGFHWKTLGYASPRAFVAAMCAGEDEHLDSFVRYVKKNGLADELRTHDWAGFARGYNGANYKRYSYDTKLAAAYAIHMLGGARADNGNPTLRMGDTGEDVMELQRKLGMVPDGDFGPNTKKKVIAFQRANRLTADGVVGAGTWRVLNGG